MSVITLISLLKQTLTLIVISLPSLINTSQLDYDTLVFKQCDTPTNNHHSYKLFEKSEHGLIHKICDGVTAETFTGFNEMRTEALTAAAAGVVKNEHGFYEDSYKLLHVVAQCQVNVRNHDCGECVSAAAAAIEEECRWSVAAQIYMDRCYVGYTYYPDKIHADSYHEEGKNVNVGKSLAIVVGVAAALVFVAIFVMFLKSLGKKRDDC